MRKAIAILTFVILHTVTLAQHASIIPISCISDIVTMCDSPSFENILNTVGCIMQNFDHLSSTCKDELVRVGIGNCGADAIELCSEQSPDQWYNCLLSNRDQIQEQTCIDLIQSIPLSSCIDSIVELCNDQNDPEASIECLQNNYQQIQDQTCEQILTDIFECEELEQGSVCEITVERLAEAYGLIETHKKDTDSTNHGGSTNRHEDDEDDNDDDDDDDDEANPSLGLIIGLSLVGVVGCSAIAYRKMRRRNMLRYYEDGLDMNDELSDLGIYDMDSDEGQSPRRFRNM